MATSVYLASAETISGKSSIAIGLLDQFSRRVHSVGVFRPVMRSDRPEDDYVLDAALSRVDPEADIAEHVGVTYQAVHEDPDAAIATILDRYHAIAGRYHVMLVLGTAYTDVGATNEFALNARIAANLAAPILLVVSAAGLTPEQVRSAAAMTVDEAHAYHAHILGVIANRVPFEVRNRFLQAMQGVAGHHPVYAVPESRTLLAPTVRDLMTAAGGRLLFGDDELLDREAITVLAAAMTLPNVLERLGVGSVVITPADRADIIVGLLLAQQSKAFPDPSAIVLSGGLTMPSQIQRLVAGLRPSLPIVAVGIDTAEAALLFDGVHGRMTRASERKIDIARMLVEENIDTAGLLATLDVAPSHAVTPLMFQHTLIERARRANRHIVLPEGEEPRILVAADQILRRKVARLTLLGDADAIRANAGSMRLNIDAATIVDPRDETLRDRFAREYARMRAGKGTTYELARDIIVERSYFGTMMVLDNLADGMVSGSVTTTAQTVRPALQVIKTMPGVGVVSSVFFMLLADRVLVYGDCAVNPDPAADELADIAISSAATATQFGIEPLVAMLSYSTGASGSGADVDKVREATDRVRERAPDLVVDGPIQYDAAVDAAVAATKLKDSPIAGRATVLIFPDLNTGNNTYKAVQRSAGAVAIGPVLQGLRKPVNDLSRGALVTDIVNTVAITAVQAADL
ncbi:MAG: phosphate acetyltransferase [Dermatophilaceae bacterium]